MSLYSISLESPNVTLCVWLQRRWLLLDERRTSRPFYPPSLIRSNAPGSRHTPCAVRPEADPFMQTHFPVAGTLRVPSAPVADLDRRVLRSVLRLPVEHSVCRPPPWLRTVRAVLPQTALRLVVPKDRPVAGLEVTEPARQSIRLNHFPPLTPFSNAVNMRSVQTVDSTQAHREFSSPNGN